MYIENMNRETQAHRDNGKKRTHEKHTHTHNVKEYATYISLPWCVRDTLLDLRLERGSINSFRALLRLFYGSIIISPLQKERERERAREREPVREREREREKERETERERQRDRERENERERERERAECIQIHKHVH
jgi:hypothetical protein